MGLTNIELENIVDFHKYGKTVAAGQMDDDAKAWLEKHGAIVKWELGIWVILLPKDAIYENVGHWWDYTIHFDHKWGDPREYVKVELSSDASTTDLVLVIEKEEETDEII